MNKAERDELAEKVKQFDNIHNRLRESEQYVAANPNAGRHGELQWMCEFITKYYTDTETIEVASSHLRVLIKNIRASDLINLEHISPSIEKP